MARSGLLPSFSIIPKTLNLRPQQPSVRLKPPPQRLLNRQERRAAKARADDNG